MINNNVLFEMSMIWDDNSFDFFKLLIDMLPFKPKHMMPVTSNKKMKYNDALFYCELFDALKKKIKFSTSVSQDFNNSFTLRYDYISNVITIVVFLEDYVPKKIDVDSINKLFCKFKILSALIRNEDDGLLSTAYKISTYERRGIDTSSLKKIINTPFKDEIIDIEQFSRHSHEYGGIQFTSTYIMWFGTDFFRFVPQETLTSFNDCFSNETLENGTVRIQLYENINDFDTEETDRRQWAFRRHTNIDEVAEKWNLEYLQMASRNKSGANMEIETGIFEHGGVKLVKMYLDSENKPAPKKLAYKMKCHEYDSSGRVLSEYEILM